MRTASARSGTYQILLLGDEHVPSLEGPMAEAARMSIRSGDPQAAIRRLEERHDAIDAVILTGPPAQSRAMLRRIRKVDEVVPVAFLVQREEVQRLRGHLMLMPDAHQCEVVLLDQPPADLIEEIKRVAESGRRSRTVHDAIGYMNREIGEWTSYREQTFQRLIASDRYLVTLLENAPDAFISTDSSGMIVAWNAGATRLFGYTRNEVHEQHLSELFDGRETDRLHDALQRAYRGEVVRTEPFLCNRKGAEQWHAEVTISPVQDDHGQSIGISVISRDVTDRVMAERASTSALEREQSARRDAELANAQLHFLAEAGSILSSSLDYKITIQRVAEVAVPHVADWAGVDMLNPAGKLKRIAIAHSDPEKVEWVRRVTAPFEKRNEENRLIRAVVDSGEPMMIEEVTDEMLVKAAIDEDHLHAMRQLGIKSAMLAPIKNQGNAVGVLTLVIAETDRRFAEADFDLIQELSRRVSVALENAMLFAEVRRFNEQLEQRVKERTAQLQAANRELEMFSYSVSHDLRSPLRAIEGFTRILVEEHGRQLDEEAMRLLEIVRRNTLRMDDLISDLLDFARMSRTRVVHASVDMTRLAQQAFVDQMSTEEDREIPFEVDELPYAWADPSLIRQVYHNLLSNAIKFTRPVRNPAIKAGFIREEDSVTYFVRDNGVGFNMEYARKLFEVFQRLHSPREFEGTGIGLAIVHRIITAHGGKIWAQSEEGSGTTIFFKLPPQPRT